MRKICLLVVSALTLAAGSLWSPALGAERDRGLQRHGDITIRSNAEFDAEHGVVAGKGSAADPYVISGWDVGWVEIKDTSAHVMIHGNRIDTLILDWIGPGVHVMNNEIGDLRVNQNVKRTGDMTSGVIAHNTFGIVGQLRHWDGVFAHNRVGSPDSCTNIPFFSCRAVNFDGFNGAHFKSNNIYGYVEVRLHGHHHSSAFGEHSHYHGADHADMVDHSKRFHEVWLSNNTIHSGDYYGLLYTDSNHAGNDRTAASETNPALNDPHIHKTRVHLTNNRVFGSGIYVDIFNADDERHLGTKTGLMEIRDNEIHIQPDRRRVEDTFSGQDGISISQATDLKLSIVGNTIDGSYGEADATTPVRKQFDYGSGIYLWQIDKARVFVLDNKVIDRTNGVYASSMSSSVEWWVDGLKTSGVERDVYYDSSVANKPHRQK